jgi:putative transposase
MSSTYLSLHYHIVFSTKYREPSIAPKWQLQMHQYLGGTINDLGGIAQSVGGVEDHVHLLIGLKATHNIADFMRDLKKTTSAWAHREISLPTFAWQEGYAAFTVSPTSRAGVRSYIENQARRHRTMSFREELINLLNNAGVEYNPAYLD